MSNRVTGTGIARPLGVGAILLAVGLYGLFTTVAARPDPPPAGGGAALPESPAEAFKQVRIAGRAADARKKAEKAPRQTGDAVPASTVEAHRLVDLAARAADDRDKAGAAILKLMRSGTLDPDWWEECLLALGELQYEPATEYVVEHIATPKVFREGVRLPGGLDDPAESAPAIGVLRQIGPAAAEPLVKAYLKGWKPEKPGEVPSNLIGYYILTTLDHPRLRVAAIGYVRVRQLDLAGQAQADDECPASTELMEYLKGFPFPRNKPFCAGP